MLNIEYNDTSFDIKLNDLVIISKIPNSHAYCIEEIIDYTQREFHVDFSSRQIDVKDLAKWVKLLKKNLSNSSTILSC